MRQIMCFVLILATGLTSCSFFSKKSALELNNTIVGINDNLYLKGKEYGTLLTDAVKTKDFSKLGACRIGFEQFIDSSKQSIINMKDVGGSEEMRNYEIELLTYEKHMVNSDFAPFEHLTAASTNDEISHLFDGIISDSKEEEVKMRKFQEIQAAFAKKNGFKLQANKVVPAPAN
jgi:hypothetical protein